MALSKDKTRLTADDIVTIKHLYEDKKSLTFIGQHLNRNHSTILYHIQKIGLKIKRDVPKCAIGYCKLKQFQGGLCRRHNDRISKYEPLRKKQAYAQDLNNLVPLRDHRAFEDQPPAEPPCDHSRSSCDCLNQGKYYKEYFKKPL